MAEKIGQASISLLNGAVHKPTVASIAKKLEIIGTSGFGSSTPGSRAPPRAALRAC